MSHCRNITVENIRYQWKVSGRSRYRGEPPAELTLTVRSPAGAFCQTRVHAKHAGDYGDDLHVAPTCAVYPWDVARVIQAAVAAGWNPREQTRQPFRLQAPLDLRDYRSGGTNFSEKPRQRHLFQ